MFTGEKTDMHLHTWYSDGRMSPEEAVRYAKKKGLNKISITDHDGVFGIPEALEAGRKCDIEVIPGIELSAAADGKGVHILGYFIDHENRELLEACQRARMSREERNNKLLDALRKKGFDLETKDMVFREGQDYLGKPQIARAMVNKGYIKCEKDAFAPGGIFEDKEIRKIKKEKITDASAISVINGAGGKAVLAHPAKIRHIGERESSEFAENLEKLLKKMKDKGLFGLECIYPDHSKKEIRMFIEIAEKLDLVPTKGSDFHGNNT